MNISAKTVVVGSVPPAGAAVAGGVILSQGSSSDTPTVDHELNPPAAQELNQPPVIPNPAPPLPPVLPRARSTPPRRTSSSIRPVSQTTKNTPSRPTYDVSVFSDSYFSSNNTSSNNVAQNNAATFLLNADPAFNQDQTFKDKWTKKFEYLKTKSSNNLVTESIFSEVLSSTYIKLASLCRDAYTGSNSVKPTSANKKFWNYPSSATNWFNKQTKLETSLSVYWSAVWHFCTVYDSSTHSTQLNKVPESWGVVK